MHRCRGQGAKGSRSRVQGQGSWRGGYAGLGVPGEAVSEPFLCSRLTPRHRAGIPPQGTLGASPAPPFRVSPDPSGAPPGTGRGAQLTPICSFLGGSGHILPHPELNSALSPICARSPAAWSGPGTGGGGGGGTTAQGPAEGGAGRGGEDTVVPVPGPPSFPGLCRAGRLPRQRYRDPGAQRAAKPPSPSPELQGIRDPEDDSGAGESASPQFLRSAQQVAPRPAAALRGERGLQDGGGGDRARGTAGGGVREGGGAEGPQASRE